MTKAKLIEVVMSYRDDKPRSFWETMDEDMLANIIELEKLRLKQQASDAVATLA